MEIKNEEKFTGKADIYKKFRPSYPKEFIDYLYSQTGFNKDSIIADIGSGTGIFSRLLLEKGSLVYCVEPNNDMRLIAENDLSVKTGFKNFVSVKAPAENTGLQEKSIDFVTVAQAFHWFDRSKFKMECNRILKAGGKVILVWNTRDQNFDFMKKDYIIRKKYCVDIKSFETEKRQKANLHDFFSDKIFEERVFRNDLILDRETYIGMTLSRSYSPSENKNPDEYYGLIKELNELFYNYNENGVIKFPQITESYIGKVY